MRKFLMLAGGMCVWSFLAGGVVIPGDSRKGAEVFQSQKCVECHSVGGKGGTSAPDLAKGAARSYTPSLMASLMWNHAPAMWAAMEKQGITKPRLTEEQAADLFAYFHSVRLFERPGDAARGKQVFASKHCADCHGISSRIAGGGPEVVSWRSLAAPIMLAQQMWNHASEMQAAMAARKIRWPALSGQELTDLLVYLQNLPQTRGRVGEFDLAPVGNGDSLFKSKGCVNCHHGKLALEKRLTAGTMVDFAVSMWGHAPRMWDYGRKTGIAPPKLEQDEMRQIVAYLWYTRLYAEPGSAERGRGVFAKKSCAACHNDPSSGAPDLKKAMAERKALLRPFSMATVLWQHGPPMLERMKEKNLAWPRFSGSEMADLIAYLNASEFRGAQPQENK